MTNKIDDVPDSSWSNISGDEEAPSRTVSLSEEVPPLVTEPPSQSTLSPVNNAVLERTGVNDVEEGQDHNSEPDIEIPPCSIELAVLHDDPLEASESDPPHLSFTELQPSATETTIHSDPSTTATTQQVPFPPPFYCPITKQLFFEPVVGPDGVSYERDVLLPAGPQNDDEDGATGLTKDQVYPNRALQAIMEDTLDLTSDTWEAGIRRFQKSMEAGIASLWRNSLFPPNSIVDDRPLPDAYYCPITFDLMHQPVIDPEGNTYERVAIVNWIRANGTSPLSRTPLAVADLYPNHAIRDMLDYLATNSSPCPPALEKWKSESAPIMPGGGEGAGTSSSALIPMGDGTYNPEFSPSPYPTTWEELDSYHDQLQRQRRKVLACTILGLICFVLALVAAIFYGGYCVFVSIWVGCCVRDSLRRLRYLRQEVAHEEQLQRQRLEDTQQRIRNLELRLERLQNTTTTGTVGTTTVSEEEQQPQEQQPEQQAQNGPSNNSNNNDNGVVLGPHAQQRQRLQQLEERLSQLRVQYMEQEQEQRRQNHLERLQELQQQQQQQHQTASSAAITPIDAQSNESNNSDA